MKNYDDYLAQLPFDALTQIDRFNKSIRKERIMKHPLFISFADYSSLDVAYFRIDDSEACAVVISFESNEKGYIRLEKEIDSYTLRLVYLSISSTRYHIYVPDTVWSIYGAENWTDQYNSPFVFEDGDSQIFMNGTGSSYFKFVEFNKYKNIFWLCSADGEDVIYGVSYGNIDSKLEGVKTIHYLRQWNQGYDSAEITSLSIPASVKRIKKLDGDFTDVTFKGVLPEFCEDSLKNASFNSTKVLTAYDMNPKKSVDILLRDRSRDKVLFAAHALTWCQPSSDGYIALTNARFDCDGETILVNTPWIATICPKNYVRSDGEVKGSVVLIGLKDGRQEHGVVYDVYESPEIIDGKIHQAQL